MPIYVFIRNAGEFYIEMAEYDLTNQLITKFRGKLIPEKIAT
jgi:hypothetical protein